MMDLFAPKIIKSHPSWVRGLKHHDGFSRSKNYKVAPLVGAWIETSPSVSQKLSTKSHPSWVRGLKPADTADASSQIGSHPSWVRGLKPITGNISVFIIGRTPRGCVD